VQRPWKIKTTHQGIVTHSLRTAAVWHASYRYHSTILQYFYTLQ